MKGIVIERALPSNAVDIYALFKESVKEGVWPNGPNPEEVKNYYFALLQEFGNPYEICFLARKGRQFLGYAHGNLAQRPWGPAVLFYKILFVTEKKRKLGIGKALTDRLIEEGKKLGVKNLELMTVDGVLPYWEKRGAKKITNYMAMEI